MPDQASNPASKLNLLLGFLLVFVLGFASGYYYLDAGRSRAALTITQDCGECAVKFQECSAPVSVPASGALGTVLGAAQTAGTQAAEGAFAGSKNSTLYHIRNCQYVNRIKAENLVWFATTAEAEASGRQPHSCVKE